MDVPGEPEQIALKIKDVQTKLDNLQAGKRQLWFVVSCQPIAETHSDKGQDTVQGPGDEETGPENAAHTLILVVGCPDDLCVLLTLFRFFKEIK